MASKTLVRKLDTIFSKYIRKRDEKDGYFVCCSCGRYLPIEQADAGHFINRRFMTVRWDERNVNAQCRYCNRFQEGNSVGYMRFMQRKHGDSVIDLLESKKGTAQYKDYELEILINEYKDKLKAIS